MKVAVGKAPFVATGNTSEHHPYDPAIGRGAVAQGVTEAGVPLWDVEVLRKDTAFGNKVTVTEYVTVPHPSCPKFDEFDQIGDRFVDLEVEVSVNKKSGGLRVNWTASGVTSALKRTA